MATREGQGLESRIDYARLLVSRAWAATFRFTAAKLAVSAAILGLTIFFSWLLRGDDPLGGFVVAVSVLGVLILGAFLWQLVTSGADMALKAERELSEARHAVSLAKRDVDIHQQRTALRNVLVSLANECSIASKKARQRLITANEEGMELDGIYGQALDVARRGQDEARRLGYERCALQLGQVMDGPPPADPEAAIAKLNELQAIIESQLRSDLYGGSP